MLQRRKTVTNKLNIGIHAGNKDKVRKYIGLFIAFAILFLVIPYCDDDLRWGGTPGLSRLANWFDGYGGRYLGYLIIILMTRFYSAKVLLQAALLTALVYLLDSIAYEKQTEYVSVLFLFFMPLMIFSDTIGWTSGFANYITSVVFSLVYVKYVYRRLDGENVTTSILHALGYVLLGCAGSLIVEHFTVYNLCLALFMIAYTFATERRVRMPEMGFLAGVVLGIALMFSNSTYRNVASGDDFYRGVNTSGMLAAMVNRFGRIINICYLELPAIVISITVVTFLIWKVRRKFLGGIAGKMADIGTAFICFANPVMLLADQTREYDHAAKNVVSLMLLLLTLVAIVVTVGVFSWQAGRFWQCMGAIISIVVPAVPFLIVSPMTYRCFCGSYIFWIVLLYQMLSLIPETCDKIFFNIELQKYLKVVAYAAIGFYICIYSSIMLQDIMRLRSVRNAEAQGKTEVTIGHLSNENFVHDITLENDEQWAGYKDFYGIDPDLKINVREEDE